MKTAKLRKIDIYIIISLACTTVFLIMLIVTKGAIAKWLAMEESFGGAYTDHFRCICYVSDIKHFYFKTTDASFPPFAFLLYYLLVLINPPEEPWDLMAWDDVMWYRYNMLVYIMLIIVISLFFKLMVDLFLPDEDKIRTTFLMLAILLSAPFMSGSIERGNIAYLVVVMVLAALYLKDKDSAVCREAALLLIAMAAGIKLYPAVAGFIYVKEKRWKEGVRLVIYGLLFFFVPFAFVGGVPALQEYCRFTLLLGKQSYCSWTNIRNYLLSISRVLGQYENSLSFVKYFIMIETLYLLLCVISLLKTKERWKTGLYIAGAMSLYVPYSYRYVACYMAIPLVMYFAEKQENQKAIYAILFGLSFTVPFYGYFTGIESDFFIFTPLYIIMIYAFFEEWIYPLVKKASGLKAAEKSI